MYLRVWYFPKTCYRILPDQRERSIVIAVIYSFNAVVKLSGYQVHTVNIWLAVTPHEAL